MNHHASAAGIIMPYGVAIGNALSQADTPTEQLIVLRDQAKAIVDAQGDLAAAVKALDAAIAERGQPGAGREAAVASDRFVVQIDGLLLAPDVKQEIELAIQNAVSAEIARIDRHAELTETPLSAIRSFGVGAGSHTPGLYLVSKDIATL